jgi:hypothetical protein
LKPDGHHRRYPPVGVTRLACLLGGSTRAEGAVNFAPLGRARTGDLHQRLLVIAFLKDGTLLTGKVDRARIVDPVSGTGIAALGGHWGD